MTTLTVALQAEVERHVKRIIRTELKGRFEENATLRKDVAALRAQFKATTTELARLCRAIEHAGSTAASGASASAKRPVSKRPAKQAKKAASNKSAARQAPTPALADGATKKLRQHRKRLGVTLIQMAQILGVAEQTVLNWENGQSAPTTPERKARLAEVMKMTPATAAAALA